MRSAGLASLLILLSVAGPTQAAPAPNQPLRGTVIAADGTPAAGAVVWAAKFTYGPMERKETTADADGRYALDLGPGRWNLWARRGTQGGEGPARHEAVEIAAGRAPEPVTIRLEERGTLRGRLLESETGRPIAGGKLFLDAGLVLTTNAEGRFEMGGLSRGDHESFVVAPGRVRLRVLFDTTARADAQLDVPVPRGGKIVGRVTDAEGKPIPGAQVGRSTSGSHFSLNALYEPCGADGRFEYDGVAFDTPGRLSSTAPGFQEDEEERLIVPADGGPLEVSFKLRPKASERANAAVPPEERLRTVSGVVRGPDTKPVAGVLVRWGYQPYVGAIQTRTDAEGKFRLAVPDKEDMLAVLPREHTPQFPRVSSGGDQAVEVAVEDGHTARGRVLDTDRKPIRDVRVITQTRSPDPRLANPFWLTESSARTDGEGRFELKGIPAVARFDFVKSGLSGLRNQTLQLDGADNMVTMLYGGALAGRVVDRNGKPIRSFRVTVNFPRERRPGDRTEGYFAGYSGMGVHFTSDDGSFVLTGVGAFCVYRVAAHAEGHGEAVADRVFSVPVNGLAGAEALTLQAGPPAALRVRVVAADGKPVAGARVTLVNGQPALDQQFAWGTSDASWDATARAKAGADGVADFPALGFSGATVAVQAPGYARQRLGWRGGQKELTVELAPEAVLTGEVRDAAGAPLRAGYVNLMARPGDQMFTRIEPDGQGRFRLAELPAGEWTLMIRGSDGLSNVHQGTVTLKAGETKSLTIEAKSR